VYYHRGVLRKEPGEREGAVADLERVLDLGPSPEIKHYAEEMLKELGRE